MKARKDQLTPRQQKFRDEYLKLGNAAKAAIAAGYSEKNARSIGSRLLTKANIVAAIDQKREKAAITAELTVQDLIVRTKRLTGKAEQCGKYDAALRGIRLLAEFGGYLTKRVEHRFPADKRPVEELTDEELHELLRDARDELREIRTGRTAEDREDSEGPEDEETEPCEEIEL